ncbi:putative integrase [Octadecabacter antarcticus 307]|uniref:Putative integrase n=1 Tax=Octadecabacter antarcticus 307 TaxID=391626 RepID=M9RGS6_9RHOB|nr:tyrosine-type recombinase/integrase [Octadecabacter antarcticus]AGI69015.1 putative integrase [Octadecabacter antarcticus 307]
MIKMRGNSFQLYKRVPRRYASVESRTFVWLSLHTDSKSLAQNKATGAWAQLVEAWEARLAGDQTDALKRFDAARELAAVRGFRYMDVGRVADLPIEDFLSRVEAIPINAGIPDRIEAAAVLGGASGVAITVSAALELYWTLAADKTLGKSADQLRRWKNPRIKAVSSFISVVSDKAINEITGDDMLDFRGWWMERIAAGEVSTNAANKDLIHFGDVLKTVNRMKRLGLVLPLSNLSFRNGEAGTRPPFTAKWIKEKLLARDALAGLNPEARSILLAMVNTGARPSELAALTSDCIKLDCAVPHISIEPIGRQLKSPNARRFIPLAGVSLDALRSLPDGFPRYRGSSASLSATVNKFLRENALTETPEHTLYSLRHSFEDRLLAAGVDERIRRDLLGHALKRERYGAGATLEHMLKVVSKVAL